MFLSVTAVVTAQDGAAESPPPEVLSAPRERAPVTRAPSVSPIGFGASVTGAIGDANDFVSQDGTQRIDYYEFSSDIATPYRISVRANGFVASSTLFRIDRDAQRFLPQQTARAWASGGLIQYSGTLGPAGTRWIRVRTLDGNQGAYTISLGLDSGGAACVPASQDSPRIAVTPGSTLQCNLDLSPTLVFNQQDGPHYFKPFHFTGNGATMTISAASSVFRPLIALADPATGQIINVQNGVLSGTFNGDVVYLVTSAEPNATGPFATGVQFGGSASAPRSVEPGAYDLLNMQVPVE